MKILLTAYTDVEALIDAINDGQVYKYVTKPWDPDEFKITVRRTIEAYELTQENRRLLKDLAQKNAELKQMKDYSEDRVEEERLRISRELHDETCQSLASLTVNMEICLKMLAAELDEARVSAIKDNIIAMREQLKESIRQVRRISMDLRPAELDSLGFISTVDQFINRYKQFPSSPEVSLFIEGSIVSLPQKLELAMFRLIQECLNNIRKHAQASSVEILLIFSDDTFEVIVKDNGIGFQAPDHLEDLLQDGHLGLVGMNERVKHFGGSLLIESSPSNGSTISVKINSQGGTFE